MLETWLISVGFLLAGVLGGWYAHPIGLALSIKRRCDELAARLDDLTERFGGFQRRDLARYARAEKSLDGDLAAQAAAILAANARRGNGSGAADAAERGLPLKDRLRRRANLLSKEGTE